MSKRPTEGEAKPELLVLRTEKQNFVLSLHYNGGKSYLNVNKKTLDNILIDFVSED